MSEEVEGEHYRITKVDFYYKLLHTTVEMFKRDQIPLQYAVGLKTTNKQEAEDMLRFLLDREKIWSEDKREFDLLKAMHRIYCLRKTLITFLEEVIRVEAAFDNFADFSWTSLKDKRKDKQPISDRLSNLREELRKTLEDLDG